MEKTIKKWKIGLQAWICLSLLLSACQTGDDFFKDPTPVSAKIHALEQDSYELGADLDGQNNFLFRMTWTKSRVFDDIGTPRYVADMTYVLEADLAANHFAAPHTVAETDKLFTDVYEQTLRGIWKALAATDEEQPQTVALRVKTIVAGQPLYSEPVLIVITPYVPVKVPPTVYIIGDMNGWNTLNKDHVLYRANNNMEDGVYTYTGYFGDGTYLKFCREEFLGSYDNLYAVESDGKLVLGGDHGAFWASGYATITIDINHMTWHIEPFHPSGANTYEGIGPIGDFCAWDNEPWMERSASDPHQWRMELSFEQGTTVKFRGDRSWANNWGTSANEYPYGVAVFDGPGASVQPGSYRIYFNDLTGHTLIKEIVN